LMLSITRRCKCRSDIGLLWVLNNLLVGGYSVGLKSYLRKSETFDKKSL
jgi:hypothetical protein